MMAKKFAKLGFELYATTGTAMVLSRRAWSVKPSRGQDPRELDENSP